MLSGIRGIEVFDGLKNTDEKLSPAIKTVLARSNNIYGFAYIHYFSHTASSIRTKPIQYE
jgi:hypothetical protein